LESPESESGEETKAASAEASFMFGGLRLLVSVAAIRCWVRAVDFSLGE
jgi:hypothetical protein